MEVLETMTNLGPIVDFVLVDLERQGQGQVHFIDMLCLVCHRQVFFTQCRRPFSLNTLHLPLV